MPDNNLRIAVCGDLPTACDLLQKEGFVHIDTYTDGFDLASNLRKGTRYDIILVYAPQGENLIDIAYSYKDQATGHWESIPMRLMNEPACTSALLEMKIALQLMAKKKSMG